MGKVLDKSKNPNFNYKKGEKNHFAIPKKPYTFLSVYSFGKHPHDVTNFIEQNIPNQNRVSRRTNQIDYNISKQNFAILLSKENFTQESGKQFVQGMNQGHGLLVPSGKPLSEAVAFPDVKPIPASFFDDLENSKNDMRSIAGVQGISSQSPNQEPKTARGMILEQQYDNTRIGGTIGEALENFAKNVFNYWVQMYYVFYDDKHYASVLGTLKAVEYIQISQNTLTGVHPLTVDVSPDSMKPKDEVSTMNQALTLWQEEALDPKTLLTILDFPDAQKTAGQVMLYKSNPQAYMALNFPEVMQQLAQLQQQQAGQGGGQVNPTNSPAGASQGNTAPQTPTSEPANASLAQVPLPS